MEYFEFYDRDPDFQDIRLAFLNAVEGFHEQTGFTSDFFSIARDLKIAVKNSSKKYPNEEGQAFTVDGQRIIVLKDSPSVSRKRFTEWHELSHHLFEILRDGEFRAFLSDLTYGDKDWANSCEEELCFESAALLLMPTHIVDDVIEEFGFSPISVFNLSEKTGASCSAAMRRIMRRKGIDSHGVLMRQDGQVLDGFQHGEKRGRYCIRHDFKIEKSHPLLSKSFHPLKIEKFVAPVPFKGGGRTWISKCMAAIDRNEHRVLAFFVDNYPVEDKDQLSLF